MVPHMNMKLLVGEESMNVKLASKVNIFNIVGFLDLCMLGLKVF